MDPNSLFLPYDDEHAEIEHNSGVIATSEDERNTYSNVMQDDAQRPPLGNQYPQEHLVSNPNSTKRTSGPLQNPVSDDSIAVD